MILIDFSNRKSVTRVEKNNEIAWYIDKGFGDPFELIPATDKKLIINVALTGNVPTREMTPHVPLTPQEIINDSQRCYQAGASIIHIHARDEKGKPTYEASVFEEIISGVKKKCEDVIICVTTSGRIFNTFYCRSQVLNLIENSKPDMASLTMGSMNFPNQAGVNSPQIIQKLANLMLERGIKPEMEIFETGMINYAKYLKRKGFFNGTLYFNLFLGLLGTMPARLIDLDHLLLTLPVDSEWAGAGVGRFQLPINIASIIKGGHVRVGLEDNIYFDRNKKMYATNEQLVNRIVHFSKKIGRDIATPSEARKMLGLDLI